MQSRGLAALLLASALSGMAGAQPMAGTGYPGPGGAPQGSAMQALFVSPAGGGQNSAYVDAHGDSVVVPASYCGPEYGPPCPEPYGAPCGPCAAPYCPPMGTNPPFSDYIDPIGVPGVNSEQCGPHYFDVRFEAVYMTRDMTFGDEVIFSAIVPDEQGAPIQVGLSSNQLEYDWEPGFRVLGRYDLCPLSVLEFGYTGIYSWETGASVTDPTPDEFGDGDIFSLWSRPSTASATDFEEYGTTPPTVQTNGGPMGQTDRSLMHSISMESDLQTAEMNYRRYWIGYSPKISGTLLAGFRYTQMDEQFRFQTMGMTDTGDVESADYSVTTRNALAGFQTGGDVWLHVAQGVRIGAEGKAGIFNNRVKLRNYMASTPPIDSEPDEFPAVAEVFRNNQVAFLTEASVDVVFDVLPSWSLRAGYEILYMNSIALAGENFNTGSPYGLQNQVPRVPFFNDQGHAFYHGAHAGLEYIW